MQRPTLCVAVKGEVGKTPTTPSVEDCIPTRSVGTRLAFAAGYEWIDTDREKYKHAAARMPAVASSRSHAERGNETKA